MASFCSKCGTELSPGAQFCASCGAPAAAPVAAPAAATPPPAIAPPPPVTALPPVAPPASSGNNAVKIILIVVAVIVALGIVGAGAFGFIVWRVAHAVHVSGSGKDVTINTPGGSISANSSETFTAADLGTDLYPGATAGKGSMRMSLPTGTMVTAVYVTSDPKDQVVAFYKEKFGSGASVIESPDGAVISASKGEQESVVVTVTANSSEYGGKTQVAIVHTTATKPS